MTFGSIGWFVIGYLLLGWAVDKITTTTLIIIVKVLDHKRQKEIENESPAQKAMRLVWPKYEESYSEKLADVKSEVMDVVTDTPKTFFTSVALGLIFWPYTIPRGTIALWRGIHGEDWRTL